MFKKLLLIIIVIAIAVAFLGGIFSVQLSPFSISIDKPEKDFSKKRRIRQKISFTARRQSIILPAICFLMRLMTK